MIDPATSPTVSPAMAPLESLVALPVVVVAAREMARGVWAVVDRVVDDWVSVVVGAGSERLEEDCIMGVLMADTKLPIELIDGWGKSHDKLPGGHFASTSQQPARQGSAPDLYRVSSTTSHWSCTERTVTRTDTSTGRYQRGPYKTVRRALSCRRRRRSRLADRRLGNSPSRWRSNRMVKYFRMHYPLVRLELDCSAPEVGSMVGYR